MTLVRFFGGLAIPLLSLTVACHKSSGTGGKTSGSGGSTTTTTTSMTGPSSTSGSASVSSGGTCNMLPPSGFQNISEGADAGYELAFTTDENGGPIVAWAEGPWSGVHTIWVKHWDACMGAWGPQLKVDGGFDQTTNTSATSPSHNVAVAYDRSKGTIAVAYETQDSTDQHLEIRYAELVKGATAFATTPAVAAQVPNQSGAVYSPGLALSGGTAHLFYQKSGALCTMTCPGLVYRTRTGGTWGPEMVVPNSQGGNGVYGVTSVALDSTGAPGVAFLTEPDGGTVYHVLFWRPAMPAAVEVMNEDQTQGEDGVSLVFDGTKPLVAATLLDFLNPPGVWFSSSADGTTWPARTPVPQDGNAFESQWVSMAKSPSGETAIVATYVGDNSAMTTPAMCGEPKVSRSTALPTFATCGPAKTAFDASYEYVGSAFGPDGKLQVAFRLPMGDAASGLMAGVIYWRDK